MKWQGLFPDIIDIRIKQITAPMKVGAVFGRSVMDKRFHIKNKMKAEKLAALGFLAMILLGSILLSLPIASADGNSISYIDALFTATTSVCVTGLVTVPTAVSWSAFGKVVILGLIQVGGLGIICVMSMVMVLARKKITLSERRLIRDSYNLEEMDGMVKLILKIVTGTLVVETIGAVMYMVVLIPEYGKAGIPMAIFNAVSCFCNAGMDIIGTTSLVDYVTNPLMNITTILLIILGGMGFIVWWDILRWFKERLLRKQGKRYKISLHSKVVLVVSAILIIGGTLLILLFDWNHPESLGMLTWKDKILAALFQSVTTRTAGFETIPQCCFTDASALVSMILMFIGGSPLGTAGGMKTTTVAVVLLFTIRFLKGDDDLVISKRRISVQNIRTAMAIVAVGFGVVLGATMMLSCVSQADFLDVLYEIVSAVATVGLTRGITSTLPAAGKLIIIVVMYIGRLGPITMMLVLMRKRKQQQQIRYPEQKIMIG